MGEVEYIKQNMERCLCKSCPVQMDSVCANERKLNLEDMLPKLKKDDLMPEPSKIAEIYCSIGKSDCKDLDPSQDCQCPKCPVFKENELTIGYFCKNGKAD